MEVRKIWHGTSRTCVSVKLQSKRVMYARRKCSGSSGSAKNGTSRTWAVRLWSKIRSHTHHQSSGNVKDVLESNMIWHGISSTHEVVRMWSESSRQAHRVGSKSSWSEASSELVDTLTKNVPEGPEMWKMFRNRPRYLSSTHEVVVMWSEWSK